MSTFAEEIETAANGEPIEAIVLSPARTDFWWGGNERDTPEELTAKPISWSDARPLLDYEYDSGFGGQDCHSFYAWTAHRILFVSEYDGATSVCVIPRNPEPGEPRSI